MPHLDLIDDEYIGVSFQYDRGVVQQLRKLNARRWNPEKRRWEVHVVHLADIMKIFMLRPEDVPPRILALYQSQWIRAKALLRVCHSFTQLEGGQVPMDKIDEATSFHVHGHQFNLHYLEGKWDGRKHLLDRRNFTFPTGLLDRVLDMLRREGVGFKIEEHREGIDHPAPAAVWRASSIQDDAPVGEREKDAVEQALRARRGLLELAPGAGKWEVMAKILETLDGEALVVTSGRAALERTVAELGRRLGRAIGQAGAGRYKPERVLVVSAPVACAAFGARLGKPLVGEEPVEDEFDVEPYARDLQIRFRETPVLLFDDLHALPADSVYQTAMRCGAAGWRFGFTASPHRPDGHDLLLEAGFGPFVHRTDISILVEAGRAVPVRATFVRPTSYPPCERDRDPEEILERAALRNEARHALVAERAVELARQGRRVVVLAHDAEHADSLVRHIPGSVLYGGQSGETVPKPGENAEVPEATVFVVPPSGEALLDRPDTTALVMAAPMTSETKALERVARCLAPAPGKVEVEVVDFLDPVPYLKEKGRRRLELFRTQRAIRVEEA